MKKLIYIAVILTGLASCSSSDEQNPGNEKGQDQVKDQIARDKERADSAMKALKKRMNDATEDTSVKMQEPREKEE